jgi:hypothetical protein
MMNDAPAPQTPHEIFAESRGFVVIATGDIDCPHCGQISTLRGGIFGASIFGFPFFSERNDRELRDRNVLALHSLAIEELAEASARGDNDTAGLDLAALLRQVRRFHFREKRRYAPVPHRPLSLRSTCALCLKAEMHSDATAPAKNSNSKIFRARRHLSRLRSSLM